MALKDETTKSREFSRVDAFLPFHVRIVSPEERKTIRSRISREALGGNSQPLPELDDIVLAECLKILNSKLDAILSILNLRENEQECFQSRNANVSGSGMSFEATEPYATGTLLEIKLILPTLSDSVLYTYGEVVRVQKSFEASQRVSVRFTEIDEDIRDLIVKFVFEKQREQLRKQRRL
jgi:hypothetical protein